MKFVLGVDPGKHGAFVLINEFGAVVDIWEMEYNGATLSAAATANTYREVLDRVHGGKLEVYIEKAFTKPTDAVQESYIAALEAVCREVVYRAQNLQNELVRANEALQPIIVRVDEARRHAQAGGGRGRVDGRVGTFNYAKSCGVLEICAAFGISYTLVHPATWCAEIHKGADSKLRAKDKSKQVLERRWPEYSRKGSVLWRQRGKSIDEGRMDAFLIAQYGLAEGRQISG